MALIDKCRMALRITTTAYDDELNEYIDAAKRDLGIAGILSSATETPDALVSTAILTYVRMKFGTPNDYDDLKASYDEQKAQLQTASGYTDWGASDV